MELYQSKEDPKRAVSGVIDIEDTLMMMKRKSEVLVAVVCLVVVLSYMIDVLSSMQLTPFFFVSMTLLALVHIYVMVIDQNNLHRVFLVLNLVLLVSGILKFYHIRYSDYGIAIGLLSGVMIVVILVRHSFFSKKESVYAKSIVLAFCVCMILQVLIIPFGRSLQSGVNSILAVMSILLFILFYKRNKNVSFLLTILFTQTCLSLINYTVTEIV